MEREKNDIEIVNELVTAIISYSSSEFLTAKAKRETEKHDSLHSPHLWQKEGLEVFFLGKQTFPWL